MKTHTLYTREDCGCFADGSYGVSHVNAAAVDLALGNDWRPEGGGEIDDEFADEALSYLNENCVEAGISFQFVDGDMLLIADEECDA